LEPPLWLCISFISCLGRNCCQVAESRTAERSWPTPQKLNRGSFHFGLAGAFPAWAAELARRFDVHEPWHDQRASVPRRSSPQWSRFFRPESVVNYVHHPAAVATCSMAGLMALANQARMFNAGVSAQGSGGQYGEAGAPASDGGTDNPGRFCAQLPARQRIGLKVNCLNDSRDHVASPGGRHRRQPTRETPGRSHHDCGVGPLPCGS